MSKENGGPAFARPAVIGGSGHQVNYGQDGMTLRDYFAAKAMVGVLSAHFCPDDYNEDVIAATAYQMAGAMLAERSK